MAISDEKTVSATTYRKSGDAVSTPTWIVALDGGQVGFWTSSGAGKGKRLRNNPEITLQPCTNRGKLVPGGVAVTGTAELVTSGPVFDQIQSKVRAKYGFMVPVTRLLNSIAHIGKGKWPYGDVGVVVTLSTAPTGAEPASEEGAAPA